MSQAFIIAEPSSILPGGGTTLTWGVCPDDGGPPAPPASVQIFIDGQLFFPLSATNDSAQPGGSAATAAVSGTLPLSRALLGDAHVDLRAFYAAGSTHTISITATGAGGAAVTSGQSTLRIRSDLPAPTLVWAGPPSPQLWKQPYTVALQVENHALAAASLGCTLFESLAGAYSNTPRGTSSTMPSLLQPGQQADASFPPLTQQWDWLTPAVWIVTGPTAKVFTYQCQITVTDEFMNAYPVLTSPPLTVEVEISNTKQTFATAALAFAYLAVLSFEVAFVWPPAAAIAASQTATAAGFGASALDPPAPDPTFSVRVPLTLPDLALSAQAEYGKFTQAANDINSLQTLLYAIEAKILGAMEAKDTKSEALQVADYGAALRKMAAAARLVAALEPAVEKQIDTALQGKDLAAALLDAQSKLHAGQLVFDAAIPPSAQATLSAGLAKLTPADLDMKPSLRTVVSALATICRCATNEAIGRYVAARPTTALKNIVLAP